MMTEKNVFDVGDPQILDVATSAEGPAGSLPLTDQFLREAPSGDVFGWTQNAAMGWKPEELGRDEFLILSTMGGLRDEDGSPLALGYHTGHWEVGLLVKAAAQAFRDLGTLPFAGFCSDPCDGRTQGTAGMFDSLAYRNDAAVVLGRLIRSLPNRKGVLGVATCDKGHPAMMMALVATRNLPAMIVPGGVTLPPRHGEDAGKVQTLGVRYANQLITLKEAAELGCRACATPGGGCQFLGTAATSQVVGEVLGLSLPHSALAPSGQPIWLESATASARALRQQQRMGLTVEQIVTESSIRNAMVVHAAFGGSTNLLLHIPAVAHAAGLVRPTIEDWIEINRTTPRLVSVLPNGPVDHTTVRVFLAGGVPEVMLHLSDSGLIDTTATTATGQSWSVVLEQWRNSDRRIRLRQRLLDSDRVHADEVIMPPMAAAKLGMKPTLAFLTGNVAPEGSVVKATSIDPGLIDGDGKFRFEGQARVFTSEPDAIASLKDPDRPVRDGHVIVLAGCGPSGTGMEETYQLTSALKHLPWARKIPLITDARFSGVSTGACIGHVGPEALAGGPIGKLQDNDWIEIEIDTTACRGSINLIGTGDQRRGASWGAAELKQRSSRADLRTAPGLPDQTRLWSALQSISGGTWGGCVYDVETILKRLEVN